VKRSQPCVLIYNPISGHGHLDSWNALFVGLLLERGYRIIVLTPDRKALESRLAQRKLVDHPMLHILDWNTPRKLHRLQRLWHWWLSYGKSYADQYPESRVTPQMPARTRIKKRVFQIIVPPLFRLSRLVHILFPQESGDPAECHYLEPVDMAYHINAALKKTPWRPDCLLNMYLDMYKTGVEGWRQFALRCRLPWGGVRFAPADPPPQEGYYSLPSLRGVCFLDEAVCQAYSTSLPDKYFQYIPDITNEELSEHPCYLAEEIMCRAAGRKIVFLGGSMVRKKNIARWSELITLADSRRWFFVQVGEVYGHTFSPADIAALERLVAHPPENLFLHTHYLPDEKEFNAIIRIADILFAVYRDFRNSSNMLSKAAYFEKPILVSDGYLMGDRVRRYGIGVVVDQDDVQGMLSAIERLAESLVSPECFAAYRGEFNEEALTSALEKFVMRAFR